MPSKGELRRLKLLLAFRVFHLRDETADNTSSWSPVKEYARLRGLL